MAQDRGFRPDIQGLRAIAVSTVVLYHLYPSLLPGGFVGVDVFFVISGFLITGHLARTLRRTGRVGMVDFYARRARRLMPAAVLVLTVTWLASLVALPKSQLEATAEQVRASALYFQNWILARDSVTYLKADDAATPVQHFWSLSVEEQFYVIWPLLFLLAGLAAWVIARRTRADADRRGALAVAVMLGLAVVVFALSLRFSSTETASNPAAAYFVTTTRIWELALGGIIALLPATLAARLGRIGALGWVGLVMIVVSAFTISGSSAFPGSIALVPVLGAGLMILCGSAQAALSPAPVMSVRPMRFMGDISYSLYLWHWPLIVLWKGYSGSGIGALDGPMILVVSLAAAWFTKVVVEDKFRLSPFISGHKWRSLATIVLAAVPVALVTIWINTQPAPFNGVLDAAHPGAAALADTSLVVPKATAVPDLVQVPHNFGAYGKGPGGCQTDQQLANETLCYWGNTTNPAKTIVLVGDSVAGQWFGALRTIVEQKKWRLITDFHSLCPFTATMARTPGGSGPYTSCNDWGKAAMTTILTKIKPDLVVTSARPTVGTVQSPKAGSAAFAQIGQGMATYWKRLIAAGIPVVGIRESPEMGTNIPDCLSRPGATPSDCAKSRSSAIKADTPIVVAASLVPKATLLDLGRYICTPTTCNPIVGNVVVYIDTHHITDTYASTVMPYIRTALLKLPALR